MKNFIRKKLREEISASEATNEAGSIDTILQGKRNVAFIASKHKPSKYIIDVIKKNGLEMIRVPSHPNFAYVVYNIIAKNDAMELLSIAEKYGGYLSYEASDKDTIRIGELLGYKKEDIDSFIERRNNRIHKLSEQFIDGQNMNKATETICNKMTISNYNEAITLVKKALSGFNETKRSEIMNKIYTPLENLKQEELKLKKDFRANGMTGDSIPDEANTYWHQIQTTICELGPTFQ